MNSSAEPGASTLEQFPQWVRDVRAPVPLPPAHSCDCQVHLFGDPKQYPPRPNAGHAAPAASFEDMQRVERVLGFERVVFVHSQIYGPDHGLLLDILEGLRDRSNYRAIGRVDDSTSDAELERLDAAGFRGTRFNFQPHLSTSNWQLVMRTLDRVREFGWHVRLHVGRDVVLEHSDTLRSIRNIPVVLDHLGYVDVTRGAEQPSCRWICDQLKNENWWVMISNGNRLSPMESGWDDAVPIARAYIAAAPERIIWGSDWPHVQWRKPRMMNDAEEVELLYRYVDNDRALLQKILVDNPARLHGFA
jgi:2-pyrone-4,6-dicarboxylate lactonase